MNQLSAKLWNRDFILLTVIQIFALFANAILTFALPFYILDISGSPALFGTVMAVGFIPLVLMSPLGGVIADRGRKQRIMFWLDFLTAITVILFMVSVGFFREVVPIVVVKLIALNIIQGIYMPTAMSAIPFLVPKNKLVPANAVGSMVFSLSNVIGPVAGTILYAAFGLFPILVLSTVVFGLTAILDLFIKIPFEKRDNEESKTRAKDLITLVLADLRECAVFGIKEKPILGKITLISFLYSIPLDAMLVVGIPIMITQLLKMDTQLLGISQGFMMGGGVLGGILAGTLEKKLSIQKSHRSLWVCTLFLVPMAMVFLLDVPTFAAYIIITISGAVVMGATGIVNIQIIAYVQLATPPQLVGKVTSVLMAIVMASFPLGQFLFGVLFERLYAIPWLTLFVAVFMALICALCSRRYFKKIV